MGREATVADDDKRGLEPGDRGRGARPAEHGVPVDARLAGAIADAVRDGILVLTPELCVESANAAYYRSFGGSPDTVLGRPLTALEAGPSSEDLRELFERLPPRRDGPGDGEVVREDVAWGGRPVRLTARWLEPARRLLLVLETIPEAGPEAAHDGSSHQDSEARFRQLADAAPALLWVSDAAGACTFVSRSWYAFTGQAAGRGLGSGWAEAVHPDDRERVQETVRAASETGIAFQADFRLRRHDGAYRWALAAGRPLLADGGAFDGFIGSVLDVHERKQAEEALRESESRFRALFTSIDEGYCLCEMVLDDDGQPADYRFLEVNPLFETMTGLRDAVGRTALELVPDLEPHWVETYAKVALGGEPLRFENGSDAMERWFDVFATPVEPYGRFALVFKDITERRHAERALTESEERYRQLSDHLEGLVAKRTEQLTLANRELEAFAYSVSHDLRAPLRGVDGFAQALLEDYADVLDETGRHYLERVRAGAQRMGVLIDELLHLSRVSRSELRRRRVDLGALAGKVAASLRARDEERRAEIAIAPELVVWGDPGLLRIALENLLENAWKFARDEEVTRIELGMEEQGGDRIFFVRDNGAGFDPVYDDKLFVPFQRLHPDERFPGTGIGLTIVQRIVALHGGHVWAESAPGEGATFYFVLGSSPARPGAGERTAGP